MSSIKTIKPQVLVMGLLMFAACSNSDETGDGLGSGGSPSSGTGGVMTTGGTAATGGMMMTGGMMATGGATTADAGPSCIPSGTLKVTSRGSAAYVIDQVSNPSLTLCRGNTYTFSIAAAGHPFYINTVNDMRTENAFNTGVTGNGIEVGDLVFSVPATAPDTLYYICSLHPAMVGTLHIVN